MDPITLIVAALAAGAAAGFQDVASSAIKDAYDELKALVQRKLAGKPKAKEVLQDHENDPDTYEKPLKKILAQEQIDQERAIVEAAQKMMSLIQSQPGGKSKYAVQIMGDIQNFAQGDYQRNTFNN